MSEERGDLTPRAAKPEWPLFTRGGHVVDLASFASDDVSFDDIAYSLSHLCRWNGHCREFYSVAQHSVLACDLMEGLRPGWGVHGLLHDAHEAYTGDIVRPVKSILNSRRIKELEGRIDDAIYEAFGLGPPSSECRLALKWTDRALLLAEARDLMWAWGEMREWRRDTQVRWKPALDAYGIEVPRIRPCSRKEARSRWRLRLASVRS